MVPAKHATSPWLASMVARELTASSAPRPVSQLQGFLLKEDNSTNGHPFLASKFKRRPKRGRSVTKCVREILVMVCDVPGAQVSKFGISSFRKFMPTIAKLLKLEGDRRADVGRWSSSLAKEDGLVPKDRVAGVFAARQAVLPDKYAPEAAALQICEAMCFLVRKTREAVLARGGINHLHITGGWDTLFTITTVSSLSSHGIQTEQFE